MFCLKRREYYEALVRLWETQVAVGLVSRSQANSDFDIQRFPVILIAGMQTWKRFIVS
jgi:hypothetical protein